MLVLLMVDSPWRWTGQPAGPAASVGVGRRRRRP